VLASPFKSKLRLEAENAVLRHPLIVLRRRLYGRVRLTNHDRWFLIQLYRWFPFILQVLTIIRPETLVRWHRTGFRCYWRWKSRAQGGRPQIDTELRALIRRMSIENPLWGAPRIHGELLKLGFEVAQSSVAKYMVKRRASPSQGWRTFLHNRAPDISAGGLFIVPTVWSGHEPCWADFITATPAFKLSVRTTPRLQPWPWFLAQMRHAKIGSCKRLHHPQAESRIRQCRRRTATNTRPTENQIDANAPHRNVVSVAAPKRRRRVGWVWSFVLNGSPLISPFVVWGIGPFPSRNASVCKWTAQLTGAFACRSQAALQCGSGPHDGCTLRYERLQSFIIFRRPWLR
jgi:hypothetical protein